MKNLASKQLDLFAYVPRVSNRFDEALLLKKLADTRRMDRNLTVMGMRPDLPADKREPIHNAERLAPFGTLVLGLRCSRCPGSAPMPKLRFAANHAAMTTDRSSLGAAIVWWGNARKAVSQPLNRGVRTVSPRGPVPNAGDEHHPHLAAGAAQGGHVILRHRRADQLIGCALRKKDWDSSRQGPWGVSSRKRSPRLDRREVLYRQKAVLQGPLDPLPDKPVIDRLDAFFSQVIDDRQSRRLDDQSDRRAIYAGPRPKGHGGDVLSAGALEIIVEQRREIGGWRGCGYPDELHFRRVTFGEQPGVEACLAALRMAPHAELGCTCSTGDGSRGPYRIEHRTSFADANEIRMRTHGAEARIVGRRDDVAALHQVPEPLYLLEMKDGERRGATRNNSCGRVGPRHDWGTAFGCGPGRNNNHAGDCDRLIMQACGPIENAIRCGASRGEHHGFLPNDRSGRANEFLSCGLVKRALCPHAPCSTKKNGGTRGGKHIENTTWNRSIRMPAHQELSNTFRKLSETANNVVVASFFSEAFAPKIRLEADRKRLDREVQLVVTDGRGEPCLLRKAYR
jgi:hypothetical protein